MDRHYPNHLRQNLDLSYFIEPRQSFVKPGNLLSQKQNLIHAIYELMPLTHPQYPLHSRYLVVSSVSYYLHETFPITRFKI